MREPRIENARIKSTMLGAEDHGILTAFVFVEGDCWGVGFGGFAFDHWNEARKRREATAYGMAWIARVLETLEVPTWEKLPGSFVRVKHDGPGGSCVAIGHPIKDRWFEPKTDAQLVALLAVQS